MNTVEILLIAGYSLQLKSAESLEDLKEMLSKAKDDGYEKIFMEQMKREYPVYYEIMEKYLPLL